MEPEVLGYLERMYIATILNDCLDQLCILSHIQLPFKDSDFSPEEELKNMDENDIEELENERGEKVDLVKWQDTRNLTRPALLENTLIAIVWNKLVSFRELSKFGKEHKLLELLITATREEIESKGTFSCLVTVILEENLRKKKFENIMRHTTETGKRIYELSRQSLQIARERRQNWETHNEIVGILKISQKKLKYKAYLKLTREKKLTNAYVEQELKDISMTYDDIVVDLENSEEATKTEEMVTKTICTFLNKRHAQLEEMLEYWMERYERQIDEAQRRLDDLRNKRSQQWDQTFCILQLYTSYSQIVDESKREELEMEKRSTREKRLLDASVRIQTWWRFIMVRKQLGPFRVKRKGKGKGKKGKKK